MVSLWFAGEKGAPPSVCAMLPPGRHSCDLDAMSGPIVHGFCCRANSAMRLEMRLNSLAYSPLNRLASFTLPQSPSSKACRTWTIAPKSVAGNPRSVPLTVALNNFTARVRSTSDKALSGEWRVDVFHSLQRIFTPRGRSVKPVTCSRPMPPMAPATIARLSVTAPAIRAATFQAPVRRSA
jgi:hypothetical protein